MAVACRRVGTELEQQRHAGHAPAEASELERAHHPRRRAGARLDLRTLAQQQAHARRRVGARGGGGSVEHLAGNAARVGAWVGLTVRPGRAGLGLRLGRAGLGTVGGRVGGTERYCRSRASMSCGALVSSSCRHCAHPAAAHRWAAPAPSALRRASRGAVPALASRRTPSQCARPCPWAQQRSSGVHPERVRACCDCGAHSTSSCAQAVLPSSHARCSSVDLSVVPGSGALAAATSRGSSSEASNWMRPSRTDCSRARMANCGVGARPAGVGGEDIRDRHARTSRGDPLRGAHYLDE